MIFHFPYVLKFTMEVIFDIDIKIVVIEFYYAMKN